MTVQCSRVMLVLTSATIGHFSQWISNVFIWESFLSLRPQLQMPFKGAIITPPQQTKNNAMRSARVSVELIFVDILNYFKSTSVLLVNYTSPVLFCVMLNVVYMDEQHQNILKLNSPLLWNTLVNIKDTVIDCKKL